MRICSDKWWDITISWISKSPYSQDKMDIWIPAIFSISQVTLLSMSLICFQGKCLIIMKTWWIMGMSSRSSLDPERPEHISLTSFSGWPRSQRCKWVTSLLSFRPSHFLIGIIMRPEQIMMRLNPSHPIRDSDRSMTFAHMMTLSRLTCSIWVKEIFVSFVKDLTPIW